jgi:drug/metabolite transporter (DMT)-like permease
MSRTLGLVAVLAVCGAAWGATQPLSKIAVSQGFMPLGIVFWQLVMATGILGLITLARGRDLPLRPAHLRMYLVIALIGTILPNWASYAAARHLPSGVLSVLLSAVPMLAFPIAIALGNDRFRWRRLAGLGLGFAGICLLLLPDASLPDPATAPWIPVALIASGFYALEGNVVARFGTAGLGPIQLLTGASAMGAVIALPLAVLSGQWIDPRGPWGAPEAAMVATALLHAGAYTTYVWLVGQAGPVFTAQVAYFVTLFGVVWAILFLNEVYSGWFWAALALMLAGLAFVQPRLRQALAPVPATGQDRS